MYLQSEIGRIVLGIRICKVYKILGEFCKRRHKATIMDLTENFTNAYYLSQETPAEKSCPPPCMKQTIKVNAKSAVPLGDGKLIVNSQNFSKSCRLQA